jgi:TolA-binding protein
MTEPQRLASFVQPELSEARIQAQWSRIVERQPQRDWTRAWWYAGGALAVAAVVLLVFGVIHRGSTQVEGPGQLVVERNAAGLESLTFPEGLTVSLQREARYRVLERSSKRVHLQLDQGAAQFEVVPGRKREVVVTAAGFDVEVVGTQFEVALLGETNKPDVAVRVQRGTVRVRSRGAGIEQGVIRTLSAGESWATRTDTEVASKPEPPTVESTEPAAAVSAVPQAAPSVMSAKELFEIAESNRLKGRSREAASALDRLRRSYPSDPRAGLAAFELGRLRMDQLGDSAGALNALSDAVRLDPSARFREDAEARIVQLYRNLGQRERCLKAQAEYQSRYPSGPHGKAVASSCAR